MRRILMAAMAGGMITFGCGGKSKRTATGGIGGIIEAAGAATELTAEAEQEIAAEEAGAKPAPGLIAGAKLPPEAFTNVPTDVSVRLSPAHLDLSSVSMEVRMEIAEPSDLPGTLLTPQEAGPSSPTVYGATLKLSVPGLYKLEFIAKARELSTATVHLARSERLSLPVFYSEADAREEIRRTLAQLGASFSEDYCATISDRKICADFHVGSLGGKAVEGYILYAGENDKPAAVQSDANYLESRKIGVLSFLRDPASPPSSLQTPLADFIKALTGIANLSPISNAGPDRPLGFCFENGSYCKGYSPKGNIKPGYTVAVDGSASSDPEGRPIQFAWTQVSGPTLTLTDTDQPRISFTPPDTPENIETYILRLTVTDQLGLSGSDDVVVDVVDNLPPVVRLFQGVKLVNCQTYRVDFGTNTIANNASAPRHVCSSASINPSLVIGDFNPDSEDPDGSIVKYAVDWGTGAIEENALGLFDVSYVDSRDDVVTLTVTDNDGATATGATTITVN